MSCFVWNSLDSEINQPIPLQLETLPLPVDVLHLFPQVGSVLRLHAGKSLNEIHQLFGGKHWFKFRKITCESHSGIWQGVFRSLCRVSILSDDDESVLCRERYLPFSVYTTVLEERFEYSLI